MMCAMNSWCWLNIVGFLIIMLQTGWTSSVLKPQKLSRALRTDWDRFSYALRAVRRVAWKISGNYRNLIEINQQLGKTQVDRKLKEQFFCDAKNGPGKRSKIPPISVNKLRPGDIDVIAVIGDSLSSANGGIANHIFHVMNEHRDISWSGGGRGTWRQFLTLPNILKEFNPRLYGYAVSNGLTVDRGSRFNVAEPMAMSLDMTYQARVIIQRMNSDPNVDMKKHWKLLTIFIGNNDLCTDACHYKDDQQKWVNLHGRDLIKVLRILRQNVPKLFVNIVSLPNLIQLLKMQNNVPLECYAVHRIGCHCLFNSYMTNAKLNSLSHGIELWDQMDMKIAEMNEFHTEDLTVVVQPFFTNITFPVNENNKIDLKYFSSDCFHFSQLGHSASAKGIWNNMLQPIGQKQIDLGIEKVFLCPTIEQPYIATMKNSQI